MNLHAEFDGSLSTRSKIGQGIPNFWVTVCILVRPMLSDRCPVCPICDVGLLWPNGSMDQDETWRAGRLGPGDIVLDGDPPPPSPNGHSPQFSADICCGQTRL